MGWRARVRIERPGLPQGQLSTAGWGVPLGDPSSEGRPLEIEGSFQGPSSPLADSGFKPVEDFANTGSASLTM